MVKNDRLSSRQGKRHEDSLPRLAHSDLAGEIHAPLGGQQGSERWREVDYLAVLSGPMTAFGTVYVVIHFFNTEKNTITKQVGLVPL
ncbi:MAG: hypothetical protein GQ559_12190 [Desulfobulbaceae bacterium]|nr:hypothetical protein [Desulfobulbaceae bacterium]